MNTDRLKQLASTFDDLRVAGFVDDEEVPCDFVLQLRLAFIELGGQLIEFRCVGDTGTLRLSLVAEFGPPPHHDDDFMAGTVSIADMVLNHPSSDNSIVNLRLWGALSVEGSLHCSAAEFELENGQVLFVDPSYHFGIRFGGVEQRDYWLESWPGASALPVWDMSDEGTRPGVV